MVTLFYEKIVSLKTRNSNGVGLGGAEDCFTIPIPAPQNHPHPHPRPHSDAEKTS